MNDMARGASAGLVSALISLIAVRFVLIAFRRVGVFLPMWTAEVLTLIGSVFLIPVLYRRFSKRRENCRVPRVKVR